MVEKRIGCLFNIYLGFLNFLLLPRGISEQLKHRPGCCTAQEIRIAQHGGVPMCKETIRTLIFPGEETLVNLFHCIRPDRVISYVEWLPVGRSDGSEEEAPGQGAVPLHWSPAVEAANENIHDVHLDPWRSMCEIQINCKLSPRPQPTIPELK